MVSYVPAVIIVIIHSSAAIVSVVRHGVVEAEMGCTRTLSESKKETSKRPLSLVTFFTLSNSPALAMCCPNNSIHTR
jgi:hypothetical protein